MMELIIYLIKFSFSLTLVYAFYALLLQRLTFYNWNRLYLLIYPFTCFLIPFINLDSCLEDPERNTNFVLQNIPPFNDLVPASSPQIFSFTIISLFSTGALIIITRLIIQYLSFRRVNKNATLLHHAGNIRIFSTDTGGSYTLGNNIYLDTEALHSSSELEKVLQHEMIHVRQQHWIDLLAAEIFCVVNWFNPFAWLLRKSIRQNLEYIADRQVLNKGYDLKEYQYLLLKISHTPRVQIAAHFSLSALKNRIYMINKMKSARVHLARFILIFPLLLLLLSAFRTVNHAHVNYIGVVSDTIPPDGQKNDILIGVISADTVTIHDNNFSKNVIYSGGEEIIIVQNLKTKQIITMTMSEWKKNQAENERKYGKLPKAPPPPVPPVAPASVTAPPVPPDAPPAIEPAPSIPPAPPAPPVAPVAPVKKKNK